MEDISLRNSSNPVKYILVHDHVKQDGMSQRLRPRRVVMVSLQGLTSQAVWVTRCIHFLVPEGALMNS